MDDFSLYFHVPFCRKKCHYCHFYVIPGKRIFFERYMSSLKIEWSQSLIFFKNKNLRSIYFGGGTPSQLPPEYLEEILSWIHSDLAHNFKDVEITLEANPEDINTSLIKKYLLMGINRLSIGVQSLNSHLLPILGREHHAQTAIKAIHTIHDAGIHNISIDLMYDLPQQSLSDWYATLSKAIKLPITHLSLYNLTIEPHTVFFKYRDKITSELPDEKTSASMYKEAIRIFTDHGFEQYEISAFAKDNALSVHNTGYWLGRLFLGLGPSAFSYWNGCRFRNIANLNRYVALLKNGDSAVDFEEKLEGEAHITEHLMIQLRLLKGIDLKIFEKRFGKLSHNLTLKLNQLQESGFLIQKKDLWRLSEKGIFFYNDVAMEII